MKNGSFDEVIPTLNNSDHNSELITQNEIKTVIQEDSVFIQDNLPLLPNLYLSSTLTEEDKENKYKNGEEETIDIQSGKIENSEEKFILQLLYWPAMAKKTTGHIALKIVKSGTTLDEDESLSDENGIIGKNGVYISYWPKGKAGFLNSVPADFHSEEKDKDTYLNYYNKKIEPKKIEMNDLDLNANRIIGEFIAFKRDNKKNKKWAVLAEYIYSILPKSENYSSHCSALVMSFLIKGDMKKYIPIYDQFGSWKHLFLLASSRIFIGTSLLAFGLYPLIEDPIEEMENPNKSFAGAIIITLLNGLSIFILEKRKECFPRQLIEMSNSDCVIGISAALGFGFFPLAHRRWISPLLYEHHFSLWKKILIDFTMFPGSVLGLYVFGKLGSGLVYLFGGTGYVNHPRNVCKWVGYVKKMKSVDKLVKKVIFEKEFCFFSITFITAITCYIVRKLGLNRENSIYIGMPLGIGINYLLIFPYIKKLNKRLIDYHSQQQSEEKKKAVQVAIDTHDRSLGQYSLTCLTTLLGIMAIISLYNRTKILDPVAESFLSFPGSIIGFLVGILLYKLYVQCRQTSVQLHESFSSLFCNNSARVSSTPSMVTQSAELKINTTKLNKEENSTTILSPRSPEYLLFK